MKKSPSYGYFFHTRRYAHAPGYPQVDILLRNAPTGEHFDPQLVTMPVQMVIDHTGEEFVAQLEVQRPWVGGGSYRVLAGPVDLIDFYGVKVDLFTFGGELLIRNDPVETFLSLQSTAPILELTSMSSIPRTLAEEVEILMAERRSEWLSDMDGYEKRLMDASPEVFYAACLQTLHEKFIHFPGLETELMQDFCSFLWGEIDALKDQDAWPENVPCLEDIL
ncbi:MAG: hypothetical protein JW726_03060 [Anaerolineales bacterium]|nr:hypothetical protein [Anaerolineales bacterium]